jgi:hypothetical protein
MEQKLNYRTFTFIGSNGLYDSFVDRYNNLFIKRVSGQQLVIGRSYCYNVNMKQFTL